MTQSIIETRCALAMNDISTAIDILDLPGRPAEIGRAIRKLESAREDLQGAYDTAARRREEADRAGKAAV